jgi:uncharacterized protein (DUF4415 family)
MKSTTKHKSPVLDADGYEETPPDIAEDMDAAFAAGPMPSDFLPPISELEFRTPKKATSIRIDADVLDWFQSMGKGYQTKINAVLRAYKKAHGSS